MANNVACECDAAEVNWSRCSCDIESTGFKKISADLMGSDAGECRILRLRPVTTNNAHETRALCPLGLSQTCVCETMPKPIRTGEFSFHSPCRNEKLTKGHARHAMKQPKRRILHRPASDPEKGLDQMSVLRRTGRMCGFLTNIENVRRRKHE